MSVTFKQDNIVILVPEWVDERGAKVPDWDDAEQVVESGWRVQPATSDELTSKGREGVSSTRKAFGPVDSILDAHCRVVFDGVTFEVEGDPLRWPSPSGTLAHVEATLRSVEG